MLLLSSRGEVVADDRGWQEGVGFGCVLEVESPGFPYRLNVRGDRKGRQGQLQGF